MQILERTNIDVKRWDALVAADPLATFFSRSWYLDATAENWCIVVDESYSAGMALPYGVRLGVATLYTPIFVRYLEWFGSEEQLLLALEQIAARFGNVHLSLSKALFPGTPEDYLYQQLQPDDERRLGSQAKRMLKKAEKAGLIVERSDEYAEVSRVIHSELKDKFSGIDAQSLEALDRLFAAAKQQGVLRTLSIGQQGGIVCLEDEQQCLYLKGTVTEEIKEQGGMYLLLNTAIEDALVGNKRFDFGGSRVEGVRRFNQNLGGVDVHYYNYRVDKTPFWFKFAKRIRSTWKK